MRLSSSRERITKLSTKLSYLSTELEVGGLPSCGTALGGGRRRDQCILVACVMPRSAKIDSLRRKRGFVPQDERASRLAVIEERLAEIGEGAEQVIVEDQKKNAVFWQGVCPLAAPSPNTFALSCVRPVASRSREVMLLFVCRGC